MFGCCDHVWLRTRTVHHNAAMASPVILIPMGMCINIMTLPKLILLIAITNVTATNRHRSSRIIALTIHATG